MACRIIDVRWIDELHCGVLLEEPGFVIAVPFWRWLEAAYEPGINQDKNKKKITQNLNTSPPRVRQIIPMHRFVLMRITRETQLMGGFSLLKRVVIQSV